MKKERRVIALPQRPVSTDNGNKKRVAAYCRVSSGSDEQLSSYHAQIHHYEVAIKTDDKYEFAGIYADEGISGTSLKKRNEFKRMMQDCQDGKIDMIL